MKRFVFFVFICGPSPSHHRDRALLLLAIGITAFLLFSATLRWQPWHVRLLIAPCCLLAPAVAVFWSARPRLLPIIVALLLWSFAPTFLLNDRPLFGHESIFTHSRESLRFHWMPHDQQAFEKAATLIAARHPRRVAFATGGNSPDYLLMHLLLTRLHPAPRFSYTNPMIRVAGDPDPLPDVIIAKPFIHQMTRTRFVAIDQTKWFSVLVPQAGNE